MGSTFAGRTLSMDRGKKRAIHPGSHREDDTSFSAPRLPVPMVVSRSADVVATGSFGIIVTVATSSTVTVAKAVEPEGNLSVKRTTVDVKVITSVSVTTGTVQDSVVKRSLVVDTADVLVVSDAEVSGSTVVVLEISVVVGSGLEVCVVLTEMVLLVVVTRSLVVEPADVLVVSDAEVSVSTVVVLEISVVVDSGLEVCVVVTDKVVDPANVLVDTEVSGSTAVVLEISVVVDSGLEVCVGLTDTVLVVDVLGSMVDV